MKAVIFKKTMKRSDVFSNYGDDYSEFVHVTRIAEDMKEVTLEELARLEKAVYLFNSSRRDYHYEVVTLVEDDEVKALVDDLLEYEVKETAKRERLEKESKAKALEAKIRAEANKKERSLKKLAKELDLSLEEVRKMVEDREKN